MKCHVPEISWHNREPVLSVDFQVSDGKIRRLATGGTDCHILIWHINIVLDGSAVNVDFVADLTRHDQSVNVVRFSPSGDILASGDDDGHIFLWKKVDKGPSNAPNIFKDSEVENKENWTFVCALRGHVKDVYDLCWSPDSKRLISGSVDNSAIIWDVEKGKNIGILSDHKGFVQGVAWDPLDQLVATLCSDRCFRIYNASTQRVLHRISKANLQETAESSTAGSARSTKLFHDDTLKSFCRRLTFSPDGELVITPSGIVESENENYINVTYVFSRHSLSKPVLYFPTMEDYTTVIRCCPILFKLRSKDNIDDKDKNTNAKPWELETTMFKLPYRMVFAVATQASVMFYDTQQRSPFGRVSKIHFTGLTDLSWSDDGRVVIVASSDGYCSFIMFEEKELGEPYVDDPSKHLSNSEVISSLPKLESPKEIVNEINTPKAPATPTNFLPPPQVAKKRVSLITLFSPKLKSSIKVTNRASTTVENSGTNQDLKPKENDELEIIYDKKRDKDYDSKVSNTIKNEENIEMSDSDKKEAGHLSPPEPMEVEVECNEEANINKLDNCQTSDAHNSENKPNNSSTSIGLQLKTLNNDSTSIGNENNSSKVQISSTADTDSEVTTGKLDLDCVMDTVSNIVNSIALSEIDEKTDRENQIKMVKSNINDESVKMIEDNSESNITDNQLIKSSPLKMAPPTNVSPRVSKQPKRVQLITLSTPPREKRPLIDKTLEFNYSSPLKSDQPSTSHSSPRISKQPRRVQLITPPQEKRPPVDEPLKDSSELINIETETPSPVKFESPTAVGSPTPPNVAKQPRRVQLITLSTPPKERRPPIDDNLF